MVSLPWEGLKLSKGDPALPTVLVPAERHQAHRNSTPTDQLKTDQLRHST
jgi:hypothetical protein